MKAACLLLVLIASAARAQDAGVEPTASDAGPLDAGAPDAGEGRPGSGDRAAAMSGMAIRRLGRRYNQDGITRLQENDPAAALAAFKQAHQLLDKRDAEVANNIGFAYFALNDLERAEHWYRAALRIDRKRGVAWQNLAELYGAPDRPEEDWSKASRYLAKAREFMGNKPAVVRMQAEILLRLGRYREALRQYESIDPRTDRERLAIGRIFLDRGQEDEALTWFERIKAPKHAASAQAFIEQIRMARTVREFELSLAEVGLPEQARTFHRNARAAIRRGERADALGQLEEALALAPMFAAANIELGDLLKQSDPRRAELAYLRALVADGHDVAVLSRLGELYTQQGNFSAAAAFMRRAVQIEPRNPNLRLELARACRRAGQVARAMTHLRTFLDEVPDNVDAREARAELAELEATFGAIAAEVERGGETDLLAVNRARQLLTQNKLREALTELDKVPAARRTPAVYNLLAFIMRRLDRRDEEARFYHASLAEDRDQPAVLQALGTLMINRGDEHGGRFILQEAADVGSAEALRVLARDDARPQTRWPNWAFDTAQLPVLMRAEDRLSRYVHHPDATYRSDAARLLREVKGRVRAVFVAGGVLGLSLLLGLISAARRFWGGADLGTLITRFPEAGPEVQRVLSAIRHEVLKHNTMVLTGLVDAIAHDDVEAASKAAWCRRSLLGAPGRADDRDSAAHRLRNYAEQLHKIGRGYGLRLNLARRDPALSALLRGFRILETCASGLDRYARLGRGRRRRLRRTLERATQLLNVDGYEAVRALLDRLRVLRIDHALLEGIYDRTRREPAFARTHFAPLDVDGAEHLPSAVAMPRHAFEDIVANLIRNAIQSSVRHGDGPVHIGLAVHDEVDMITGLQRLVLLIRDRSPQQLTPEMLRGRYIEEGLGLTADLVSQYEGSLDVIEATAPWTKAVMFQLPQVDEMSEDSA